jgi:hypothetical protein
MDCLRLALMFVAGILIASCSEKASPKQEQAKETEARRSPASEPEEEKERQPREDEVAEDCVAFLRATKVVPAKNPKADCPDCAVEGAEVLSFQQIQTDRISCSADTCEVAVTIRATFKPGAGETIMGGLTAWLSQEQRAAYLNGHPPSGQQIYRVKVTYKWTGKRWRAAEFDKADPR